MIKYVGSVVIYKIIDPHNNLLMALDGKILRGLFEHERLNTANIRTSQGNAQNLTQLRQVMNAGLKFESTDRQDLIIYKTKYIFIHKEKYLHMYIIR